MFALFRGCFQHLKHDSNVNNLEIYRWKQLQLRNLKYNTFSESYLSCAGRVSNMNSNDSATLDITDACVACEVVTSCASIVSVRHTIL